MRYQIRATNQGYGVWDTYLNEWVESELGQSVDMSELDAETLLLDLIRARKLITNADEEITMQDALEDARKVGTDYGKAAASWVFDGNTSEAYYRWVLRGIEGGDPAVLDSLPEPSASDYSVRELCQEIDVDYDLTSTKEVDELHDAFLDEARDVFQSEVERLAREHLGG